MFWETSLWIFNLLSTIFWITRARGFQIWDLALKHSTSQFALNIRTLWTRVTRFNPYGFLVLLNMTLSIWVNLHFFAFISWFHSKYKHQNKKVLNRLSLRRCYTVKCIVQLVPPQCRQNIARQVARNISPGRLYVFPRWFHSVTTPSAWGVFLIRSYNFG